MKMTIEVEKLIQTIRQLPKTDREYLIESVSQMQTKSDIQDLADLKSQYPNEWLAVMIPPEEDRYDPKRGRLIAHSPDRSFVWRQVAKMSASEDVYVFFNGPIAAKGFEIVFHETADTPEVATVND